MVIDEVISSGKAHIVMYFTKGVYCKKRCFIAGLYFFNEK